MTLTRSKAVLPHSSVMMEDFKNLVSKITSPAGIIGIAIVSLLALGIYYYRHMSPKQEPLSKEYNDFRKNFGDDPEKDEASQSIYKDRKTKKEKVLPLLIELNTESKPFLDRDLHISLYNSSTNKSSKKVLQPSMKTRNSRHYYTGYDYDFDSCYDSFRQKLYDEFGGTEGTQLFGSATQRVRYANQGAGWVWKTMKFNDQGDWAHEFLETE